LQSTHAYVYLGESIESTPNISKAGAN